MYLTMTEHCEGDMSVLVNYGRVQGGLGKGKKGRNLCKDLDTKFFILGDPRQELT